MVQSERVARAESKDGFIFFIETWQKSQIAD